VDDHEWLAARFEANRSQLRAMAYRMLGSVSDADDAVQETWLRLSRAGTSDVENLGGWLTTVVAHVSLDMLRARKSRREEVLSAQIGAPAASLMDAHDPEHDVLLADSVGLALLVVLETLAPAERLAFVLHDLFGVPFDEIAPIVERNTAATRKLASRARRRVQGASITSDPDRARQRAIVDAFLAASRDGDFEALLAMLDPNVVLRSDAVAAEMGSPAEVLGASSVANFFAGRRARAAQLALIDGAPGAVWAPGGQPRVVFAFTIRDGKIAAINFLADPARLGEIDLEILTG
jgi:RNA polymerase sigma factor (sigma-70 family)